MSRFPDIDRWQREADRKNVAILGMGFFLPLGLLALAAWALGFRC